MLHFKKLYPYSCKRLRDRFYILKSADLLRYNEWLFERQNLSTPATERLPSTWCLKYDVYSGSTRTHLGDVSYLAYKQESDSGAIRKYLVEKRTSTYSPDDLTLIAEFQFNRVKFKAPFGFIMFDTMPVLDSANPSALKKWSVHATIAICCQEFESQKNAIFEIAKHFQPLAHQRSKVLQHLALNSRELYNQLREWNFVPFDEEYYETNQLLRDSDPVDFDLMVNVPSVVYLSEDEYGEEWLPCEEEEAWEPRKSNLGAAAADW